MPTIEPDNPAARLYLILERLQNSDNQKSISAAWSKALGTPQGGKLYSRVGLVYNLPQEIERCLQQRDDYDPHDMAWWGPLSGGLVHWGMREAWSNAHQAVTELGPIRAIARRLHKSAPEPMLPASVLDELREHIAQARKAVRAEVDVDEDLTDFLLRQLTCMVDLLDDIQIVGAVGVRWPLESLVVDVVAKAPQIQQTLSPEAWQFWEVLLKRTREVFATVTVVVGSIGTGAGTLVAVDAAANVLKSPQLEERRAPRERPQLGDPPPAPPDDTQDADFREVDDKKDEAA